MTTVAIPSLPRLRVSEAIAWIVLVISMVALVLIQFLGSVGAYAFVGLWFIFGLFRPKSSARALTAHWQLWVFPVLTAVSAIWSVTPYESLRYSGEFAATVAFALIAAENLPPRYFATALVVAMSIVELLSIINGRYDYDPISASYVFLGIFNSKNQLSFFTDLMLLASFFILSSGRRYYSVAWKTFVFFAIILDAVILWKAKSATSQIVAIIGPFILLGINVFSKLTRRNRGLTAIMMGVPLLAVTVIASLYIDQLMHAFLSIVGRDATLTGRTVLWDRALYLIAKRPALGLGFDAFWRPSSIEAENLWRMFYIPNPTGFNFHNTYLETAVELGFIGCAILIAVVMDALVRSMRWSLRAQSPVASFYASIIVILVIRSFVEVEITYQFDVACLVFYASLYYAYRHLKSLPSMLEACGSVD